MREEDWNALLWSIQERRCILMLGPELDRQSPEGSLSSRLASELHKDLEDPGLPDSDLPQAAYYYQRAHNRSALERAVVDFHKRHRDEAPPQVLTDLASLPLYLVLTSCHDRRMVRAFEGAGKAARQAWYHFRGDAEKLVSMGTEQEPLVYHLYGALDEARSMVLGENDLLDFLVSVITSTPPIPHNLRSELTKPDNTFLFLGFGIKHWYLRILLHALRIRSGENTSFALEDIAPDREEDRQIMLFYRMGYRIELLDEGVAEFATELRRRFEASEGADEKSEPRLDGPRVFVSYAHEDRVWADRVVDALEAAGFRPWLDRDRLEAGDYWNSAIETELERADYVVVLQSHALAAKYDSNHYVNKEINRALSRAEYFPRGRAFILPVSIDDSPTRADLADQHVLSLGAEADLSILTSKIRREQERRKRD